MPSRRACSVERRTPVAREAPSLTRRGARRRNEVMMTRGRTLVTLAALTVAGFVGAPEAGAVSQWSRKYQVACAVCHTVVPRINYYGERFMRNGYQLPDTRD